MIFSKVNGISPPTPKNEFLIKMKWIVFGRYGCPYSEKAAQHTGVLAFMKPYNQERESRLFKCVECAYRDDQSGAMEAFMQECCKLNVTRIKNTTHATYSTVPLCFKLDGSCLTFVGGASNMIAFTAKQNH